MTTERSENAPSSTERKDRPSTGHVPSEHRCPVHFVRGTQYRYRGVRHTGMKYNRTPTQVLVPSRHVLKYLGVVSNYRLVCKDFIPLDYTTSVTFFDICKCGNVIAFISMRPSVRGVVFNCIDLHQIQMEFFLENFHRLDNIVQRMSQRPSIT